MHSTTNMNAAHAQRFQKQDSTCWRRCPTMWRALAYRTRYDRRERQSYRFRHGQRGIFLRYIDVRDARAWGSLRLPDAAAGEMLAAPHLPQSAYLALVRSAYLALVRKERPRSYAAGANSYRRVMGGRGEGDPALWHQRAICLKVA
jgi:hypothetical protein